MHTDTIAQLERQLSAARAAHDAEIARNAARVEREDAEQRAAADAEEARLIKEWQASWRHTRIRCVIPPGVDTTHFCFNQIGRRWRDHKGQEHEGAEWIPVLQDGPDRVVWLRDYNDFTALLGRGSHTVAIQRANADLERRHAASRG